MENLLARIKKLQDRLNELWQALNLDKSKIELAKRRAIMESPNFWSNQEQAVKVSKEAEEIMREVEKWEKIKKGTITADDLHRYAFEVSALGNDDPARSTRVMFSEFAGNKAMLAIFESSGLRKKEEK